MTPRAREADLLIREVEDETLVYDLARHRAHCLNRTAVQVWRLCDGKRDERAIARALARELDAPVDEAVVSLALGRLDKAGLLERSPALPAASPRFSRRAALRRLAQAGGVAFILPAVWSIVAPTASAVASVMCLARTSCPSNNMACCCSTTNTIMGCNGFRSCGGANPGNCQFCRCP